MSARKSQEPEETQGERVPVSFRVTATLKERLDAAAEKNGRSQAQECELRLERSFDHQDLLADALALAYGQHEAGLILLAATAMDIAGRHSQFMATGKLLSWVDDPFAYDQAAQAALKIIEIMRPPGDSKAPARAQKIPFASNLGDATANGLRLAARGDNDGLLGPMATERLRKLLGTLVDRLAEKRKP